MTTGSVEIASVILLIVFGGALLGIAISGLLPAHHLSSDSKAAVSVSMAVIGTMTALVIGLLISTANTSFRAREADVARLSSGIVQLDSLLRHYGPETDAIPKLCKATQPRNTGICFRAKPGMKRSVDNPATAKLLDDLQDRILTLEPADDRQRWLSAQALQLAAKIGEDRALLTEENTNSLPLPFLGAVVLWLTVLFASFGLFAPRNVTVVVALFLCALAVSMAFKLILDLDMPFEGKIRLSPPPIRISGDAMRHALDSIRRPDEP